MSVFHSVDSRTKPISGSLTVRAVAYVRLQLADVCKMNGDLRTAAGFVERTLYCYEASLKIKCYHFFVYLLVGSLSCPNPF